MERIKQNPFIYSIYYWLVINFPRRISIAVKRLLRLENRKRNYDKIKIYKDKYKGQRCFIVATAPSLAMEDLELIKGEKSFGVNSIVLAYDKTEWRPTFYGLQDKGAYERLEDKILASRDQIEEMFCGISVPALSPKVKCSCCYYRLNLLDHDRRGTDHRNKCDKNVDRFVYDGHSITYSMMEIAMYMGFQEIILLGVDCDYSGKQMHFASYTDNKVMNAAENMYKSYCEMKKYAEKEGIRIMNASRGWKLDVFECVKLEDIISKK